MTQPKIVVRPAIQRQTPPGEPMDVQKTIEAGRAVTDAASDFLYFLAQWRAESLMWARLRVVGPGLVPSGPPPNQYKGDDTASMH